MTSTWGKGMAAVAEVGVVADDVVGAGDDGAVHELVVVGVALDEAEVEVGVELAEVAAVDEQQHDVFGYGGRAGDTFDDFLIFAQNFVADAERVAFLDEGSPGGIVGAGGGQHLHRAVGVQYDVAAAHCL